ncbi:hypothetical protein JXO59_02755, partial [candidate division KSB1 bacterium]|nr:hypothetical protein [candidate division KSB1 bacterium]
SADWSAEWQWPDSAVLAMHFAEQPNSRIITAQAPGERLKSMHGRQKPALIVRREGENVRSEFVGVYEPHRGRGVVQRVEKIAVSPHADWAVVLKVQREGEIDYILSSYLDLSPQQEPFRDGDLAIPWQSRFGVVTVKEGRIVEQEWVTGVMEGLRHGL